MFGIQSNQSLANVMNARGCRYHDSDYTLKVEDIAPGSFGRSRIIASVTWKNSWATSQEEKNSRSANISVHLMGRNT